MFYHILTIVQVALYNLLKKSPENTEVSLSSRIAVFHLCARGIESVYRMWLMVWRFSTDARAWGFLLMTPTSWPWSLLYKKEEATPGRLEEAPCPTGWKSVLVITNVPATPSGPDEVIQMVRGLGPVQNFLVLENHMVRHYFYIPLLKFNLNGGVGTIWSSQVQKRARFWSKETNKSLPSLLSPILRFSVL